MAKHLIIGLGGTGGDIICEIRKRIYEDYRNIDPQVKDVFIDYLYVDSSRADLQGLDAEGKRLDGYAKKWSALGTNIALNPAQTLFIGGLEKEKIDNIYKYNNLNGFFNEKDREDTAQGISQIVGAGIGGQRRRFGRMLFANNILNNPSFVTLLQARVNDLQNKAKAQGDNIGNITFHICAGLGGGTGSGTIIDTIAQIRRLFPQGGNENQYRICLYLYIPEALQNMQRDKEGYYRPNGYAALLELNAMSIGAFQPIDITNTKDIEAEEKRIKNAGFNAAYIYTNRNAAGNQYNLDELPKIAADFLFQKLLQGISARFEHNENAGTMPEDINGTPVHSTRFMSFGIKRLIYPETEIQEYAAYRYSYTAAMQMVYGWPKGAHYPVELTYDQVNVSANEIKGKDDFFMGRQTLHITDTRLKIDNVYFEKYADLAKKGSWSGFKDFWKGVSDKLYSQLVGKNVEKNLWVTRYSQEMQKQYSTYFRGNGVDNFYMSCKDDKVFLADEITNHIGNYLMTEWKLGRRSLAELEKYVTILIEDCRERYDRYDRSISEVSSQIQKTNKEAQELAEKFVGSGWLKDITGRSTKTFELYTEAMCKRYTLQTDKVAYEFAKILMEELITHINTLLGNIKTLKENMLRFIKEQNELAEAKCQIGDGGYNASSEVVKLYEPENIRKMVDGFIHEEDKQKTAIAQLRENICNSITDGSNLIGLAKRSENDDMMSLYITNGSRENASARMLDYATENKNQKLIEANVLDKLHQKDDWAEMVDKLCNDAIILIEQDGTQVEADKKASTMVSLGIPEYPEDENFRDLVIERVRNNFAGKGYNDCVAYKTLESQLVLLTGKSAFALRYIKTIATLKEAYDKFTKGNISHYKIVHTESFYTPLPSLYDKSAEDLKEELYSLLLVAYSIPGIVENETNGETGEKNNAVALKVKDGKRTAYNRLDLPDDMASEFIFMGKNIVDALDILSKREDNVIILSALIANQLNKKYAHNQKKEELIATIKKLLKNDIARHYDNDTTNKQLQAFVKAADKLFENELKLK